MPSGSSHQPPQRDIANLHLACPDWRPDQFPTYQNTYAKDPRLLPKYHSKKATSTPKLAKPSYQHSLKHFFRKGKAIQFSYQREKTEFLIPLDWTHIVERHIQEQASAGDLDNIARYRDTLVKHLIDQGRTVEAQLVKPPSL